MDGPLLLGDDTWDGIARMLSVQLDVKNLQLEGLMTPFNVLFVEHGYKPRCPVFKEAFKTLVSQLVGRLTWKWKANLLKLQEGYLSHKRVGS